MHSASPLASASAQSEDKVICKLCRRQFSRYICPTCNVPYCSLTCFRGEAHGTCSETFYRKEVASDIQSEPSKSAKERLAMMDLLKRFEEESLVEDSDPTLDDDEDDDDPTGLAQRLAHVDIGSASHEALWSLLTPEERAKFTQAFENPSSELAQELLASDEIDHDRRQPWWANLSENDDTKRPVSSLSVPATMVRPVPNNPALGYNVCALCIAYAYVIRNISVSCLSSLSPGTAEHQEAKHLISELVPFLTTRGSTTAHPSLSATITDTWSRFGTGKMNSAFFAVLLNDAAYFLLPRTIIPLDEPFSAPPTGYDWMSHPHRNIVFVLSDLAQLFSTTRNHEPKRPNRVIQKLVFYAAHILSTPVVLLEDLADEVVARAAIYHAEDRPSPSEPSTSASLQTPQAHLEKSDSVPLVVELS